MVINESFMLQIKHFHLCAGGVAVRKDLRGNCFSVLHTVDQLDLGYLEGALPLLTSERVDVCCLSGGQDFLTCFLPESFPTRWKVFECGICA